MAWSIAPPKNNPERKSATFEDFIWHPGDGASARYGRPPRPKRYFLETAFAGAAPGLTVWAVIMFLSSGPDATMQSAMRVCIAR